MTEAIADPAAVQTNPPAAPASAAVTSPPAAGSTVTSPSNANTGAAEATSSASFDAASIEDAFGLPAGSLKDVTDMDSALSAVREYTDKTTAAGLGLESPFATKTAPAAPAAAPAKQPGQPAAKAGEEGQPQYLTKTDLDNYFAERDTAAKTQQESAMLAELDRRLDAEIDSWASPRYGVGKQRNVKQIKAHNELKGLIVTHIAGAAATGQPLPIGEVLARRVRLIDDDTYKPAGQATAQAPLGTPGAAKAATAQAKEGPRNIHEAVLGRKIS